MLGFGDSTLSAPLESRALPAPGRSPLRERAAEAVTTRPPTCTAKQHGPVHLCRGRETQQGRDHLGEQTGAVAFLGAGLGASLSQLSEQGVLVRLLAGQRPDVLAPPLRLQVPSPATRWGPGNPPCCELLTAPAAVGSLCGGHFIRGGHVVGHEAMLPCAAGVSNVRARPGCPGLDASFAVPLGTRPQRLARPRQ